MAFLISQPPGETAGVNWASFYSFLGPVAKRVQIDNLDLQLDIYGICQVLPLKVENLSHGGLALFPTHDDGLLPQFSLNCLNTIVHVVRLLKPFL